MRQEILVGKAENSPGLHFLLPTIICTNHIKIFIQVLVDSGVKQNLTNLDLTEQLQLHITLLQFPLSVTALTR